MKLLLDTHILLWALSEPERVPTQARSMLSNDSNQLYFSVASIWETAIKASRHSNFNVNPILLRETLLGNSYEEWKISSQHAITAANLPSIHKDPFDRILIAQAIVERALFITADRLLATYPAQIHLL